MHSWAIAEVGHARLGDHRLTTRLIRLVTDLAAQPTASLPQACGTPAATKAAYRFFDTETVVPQAIQAAHQQATLQRMRGAPLVLAIQDTTDLDFRHHPSTQGLGPINSAGSPGLKVHSVLAVSPAGVPLGLLHQAVWVRDPTLTKKREHRRQRETAQKESQRWLTAFALTQACVPEATRVLTIADREADIYDLFALPRRLGADLLIRATQNRRVEPEAQYLWEAIRQAPLGGQMQVEVQRAPERPARQATLAVRWASLEVAPPRHRRQRKRLPPLPLHVVLAEEVDPPAGVTPICWLLITTLSIATWAEAVACVHWYTLRWLIERYHFVLKSGCRLEALQLETAGRLERALAVYSLVAWRLLWVTYEARAHPEASSATVLALPEWQALYCTIHRTPHPPAQPPSLREAVRWIAQLGGFLGRKSDGEPGVQTIWRGLRRLEDIAATWALAHGLTPPELPGVMGNG
jgi:hypothetical protein